MRLKRVLFLLLIFALQFSISANDSSIIEEVPGDTVKVVQEEVLDDSISKVESKEFATAPKGDIAALFYNTEVEKKEKLKLLNEDLNKKRKVAIIGNVVLASSLLLEYGLILPASLDIDPDDPDLNDQIALLSPQILAFMMKTAGTTMISMRTSETIDSYMSITGDSEPKNISWKLYWASWGATLVSGFVSFAAIAPPLEDYTDELAAASMGIAILGDCLRVTNGIYSMLLIKKMKTNARSIPVRVNPTIGLNGEPGLSMKVKF